MVADRVMIRYFEDSVHNNDYLKSRFQKLYFDGYLSKYDFYIHEFNNNGQPLSADKRFELNNFRDLVLFSAVKVSDYFYRDNYSFGFQHYFALLPITSNGKNLGIVVIELKSKSLQIADSFPALLIDAHVRPENEFQNYSYAYYADGKLVSQHGDYVYNLVNTEFKGIIKKYVEVTTRPDDGPWYNR